MVTNKQYHYFVKIMAILIYFWLVPLIYFLIGLYKAIRLILLTEKQADKMVDYHGEDHKLNELMYLFDDLNLK